MARQYINEKQKKIIYSTEEQLTGDIWIDGSPIYRKTVYIGNLPNDTTSVVPHGISGLDLVIRIWGIAGSSNTRISLPFVSGTGATSEVAVFTVGDNIHIRGNSDRSAFDGYVTLEYIKT